MRWLILTLLFVAGTGRACDWRRLGWGDLRIFFNEGTEDLSLEPSHATPTSVYWEEAGRREKFSAEPGALIFDRAAFSRIAAFRQDPTPGTFASRLNGEQWGRLTEALYAAQVRAAFRDPARVSFQDLAGALQPTLEVVARGRMRFVRERVGGRVRFAFSSFPDGTVQLVLPTPDKLLFVDHKYGTGLTDAVVLTVHFPNVGEARVWDIKPLVDDHGWGRWRSYESSAPLREARRLGRLAAAYAELGQLRARANWAAQADEVYGRQLARFIPVSLVVPGAAAVAAINYLENIGWRGQPVVLGAAASAMGVALVGAAALRVFAPNAKRELPQLGWRIASLKNEIRLLEADAQPAAPKAFRLDFEGVASSQKLYVPRDAGLARYWNQIRNEVDGREGPRLLSIFRRAERLLGPTGRAQLLERMKAAEERTDERARGPYDRAYEAGDAFLGRIEQTGKFTVVAQPFATLYEDAPPAAAPSASRRGSED